MDNLELEYTIDYLSSHPDYKIFQGKDFYHFNSDTCLLGEHMEIDDHDEVLDIGTNNGALLVYAYYQTNKNCKMTGIEINGAAAEFAKMTFDYHEMDVDLIIDDVITHNFDKKFDKIICNPPYFKSDVSEQNENENIATARHQQFDLHEFTDKIHDLLKDTGYAFLIYPFTEHQRFMEAFTKSKLFVAVANAYNFDNGSHISIIVSLKKRA